MIFLPLKDWPIGEQRLLLRSKIYNLEVFITRTSNKSFAAFKTSVDCFVLNIEQLGENKSNKNILIDFSKINFLEDVIASFYHKIMDYYDKHNDKHLQSQIDLKVDGLNLRYLKSGIFQSRGNVDDIIKVLLSQLLAAHRSDESLVINRSLKVFLTVSNIMVKVPH